MMQSPFKRALRNTLLITFIVGLAVHLQGTRVAASLMSMIYTLIVVMPILWITYRYTHKIRMKYEAERLTQEAEHTAVSENESNNDSNTSPPPL